MVTFVITPPYWGACSNYKGAKFKGQNLFIPLFFTLCAPIQFIF